MSDLRTIAGQGEEIMEIIGRQRGLFVGWFLENRLRRLAVADLEMRGKIVRLAEQPGLPWVAYRVAGPEELEIEWARKW
jgi:hypothetical protein